MKIRPSLTISKDGLITHNIHLETTMSQLWTGSGKNNSAKYGQKLGFSQSEINPFQIAKDSIFGKIHLPLDDIERMGGNLSK